MGKLSKFSMILIGVLAVQCAKADSEPQEILDYDSIHQQFIGEFSSVSDVKKKQYLNP